MLEKLIKLFVIALMKHDSSAAIEKQKQPSLAICNIKLPDGLLTSLDLKNGRKLYNNWLADGILSSYIFGLIFWLAEF
jgi:hypothetical protein